MKKTRLATAIELDAFLSTMIQERSEIISQRNNTTSSVKRRELSEDLRFLTLDIKETREKRAQLHRI